MAGFNKAKEIAILLADGVPRREVMKKMNMTSHYLNLHMNYLWTKASLPSKTGAYPYIDKKKMMENLDNLEARIDRYEEFIRQEKARAKAEMHDLTGW